MFTKKLFWVLVFGFKNLVSVDAKERSYDSHVLDNLNILLRPVSTMSESYFVSKIV